MGSAIVHDQILGMYLAAERFGQDGLQQEGMKVDKTLSSRYVGEKCLVERIEGAYSMSCCYKQPMAN
jgi:hypothetical protein